MISHYIASGVEVGFNQSYLFASEGQSEATNVCVQITSGILERNISVYLQTLSGNIEGGRTKVFQLC